MVIHFLYFITLFILFIYSFFLVDPNITFFQNNLWVRFRDWAVYLGYYRRDISWVIYLMLVVSLFILSFYLIKRQKQINIFKLALIIGAVLLLSYPFLSHDFFNYMFDAKIFTFYQQNPYLKTALDFPADKWTRFMHWTHRSYPYGPVFLILSFIPSFIGFGKFTLTFILFKVFFVGAYLISVYCLQKIDRKSAIIFATHPLIILEGLVSSHNDLIAVALAITGSIFLLKKKNLLSRFLFLLSVGIKYTTLPILFLTKDKKLINRLIFVIQIFLLLYVINKLGVIQPWYFLTLFIFLPWYEQLISRLNIFFAGLLFSYYPYIRLGGWDQVYKVEMKQQIIYIFAALNIAYLFFIELKKKFFKR